MRNQARALVLVFLSLLTAMVLGVASALMGAVALGATALIVPGTGTPDPDTISNYRENAWDRYIEGVACPEGPADCPTPVLDGIDYPASFWPLSFIPKWCVPGRCEKWDVSVDEGVEHLKATLAPFLLETSDEDVYIFGYSQGGAVVANTLAYLDGLKLSDEVKNRLKVVTIGGIENPDGGLWQRFAWLRYLLGDPVPILDLSFEPGMPVDTGIESTTIGFEYDPVVYAPRYWGNIFAVLNALAAFDTVHGYYLAPDGDDDPNSTMPYGYTPETLAPQLDCDANPANCRTDSFGNTYILIPATSLPLTNLLRSLTDSMGIRPLAKPCIDLVEPVLKVMVDLGFDWTGDPGISRGSTILPFKIFQNWFQVGVDLAVATVQGIEAFLGNFGIGPAAELQIPNDKAATLSVEADPSPAKETEDTTTLGLTADLGNGAENGTFTALDETEQETTGVPGVPDTTVGDEPVVTEEQNTGEPAEVTTEVEVTEDPEVVEDDDVVTEDDEVTDGDQESANDEAEDTATATAESDTPAAA